MRADTIVAYTYQAGVFGGYNCDCMLYLANIWLAADGVKVPYEDVEDALDAWAVSAKIDRYNEHSFDSDAFPKVIFAIDVSSRHEDSDEPYFERCSGCGEEVI